MPETPAENVARSLISITLLFSKVSSVQSFENSRMCINKKFLLDPKPVGGHGASLLAAMTTAAAEDSSGNDGGKDYGRRRRRT